MKTFLQYTFLFTLLSFKLLAQAPPPSDGLIAYWPLDETSGSTAGDATGNSHTGTLINAPTWSSTGRVGGCLEIQDNAARQILVSSLTWQPTAFSISFWLNPYSFTQWSHAIGSNIGWGGFLFHSSPSGEIYVGTDVNTRFYLGGGTVQLNKWQHYTFTYVNGVAKFYKNGQLLASRTGMTAPVAWQGFRISNPDSRNAIHGKIDDIRVYNRALTDQEVAQLAAWPQGALAAVWKSNASTTDWHTGSNWVGGIVPGPEAEVTINASSNYPTLATDVTIDRLRMEGGQLSLNGKVLKTQSLFWVQSTLNSNGGSLLTNNSERFSRVTINGGLTYQIGHSGVYGGGIINGGNVFNGALNLTLNSDRPSFRIGSDGEANMFKGDVVFSNVGGGWVSVNGETGTVFERKVEIRNEGWGALYVPDYGKITFKGETTIINHSSLYLEVGNRIGSVAIFEGPLTVSNTGRNGINNNRLGLSNCTFHSTVAVSNTVPHYLASVVIGAQGYPCVFKSTATLQNGTPGITRGGLVLSYVTHENPGLGTNLQLVNVHSDGARVQLGPNVTFAGEVDIKAPHIFLNGSTFGKTTKIEKYGGAYGYNGNNYGGNLFNGSTTLINSSGQAWSFGQGAKDIFNGDLTVTHTGGNGTQLAHWSSGHEFNGNVQLNITAGSTGSIQLGSAGGSSILKEGKTFSVGNISSGWLALHNLTQKGTTPQTLNLTGSASLYLSAGNVFNAPLTASAPQLYLYGSTYYKPVFFTKTGNGQNNSGGSNKFYGKVNIVNQSTSGTVNMATGVSDVIEPPPVNPTASN